MQTKALVAAITIIVLALGAVGAAFATGMDFSNVGALSSGEAKVPQVNTDHVGFLSSPDRCGVDRIALSFDRDLTAGTTIWVTISGNVDGYKVLASPLSKDQEIIIQLERILKVGDIGSGDKDGDNGNKDGDNGDKDGDNGCGHEVGDNSSVDIVVTVAER